MAKKMHEFLIKISGKLDSSITKSLSNLQNSLKNLSGARNIKQVAQHAAAFKMLRNASEKASEQMSHSKKIIAELSRQMADNRKIVSQIGKQYRESKGASEAIKLQQEEARAQKQNLQTQLKALKDAGISKQSEGYKRIQSEIQATSERIRTLGANYRQSMENTRQFAQANRIASRELESLEANIQHHQNSLNRLQREQRDRSRQMVEHQRFMRESGYSGNFEEQSRRIENERARRESYDTARSNMHARFQRVQDSYGDFQQAQGIADSILSPFKNALDVAMDFEVATSRTQAIMSGGGKVVNMDKIVNMAKKLGAETNFTASQAMDSAYYAAIAGWNEQQILAAMPTSLDLANAGGITIDRAMDIISDEMTAYGLDTKNESVVRKFADEFGYTITKANTNAEDLHLAASYIAPVANSVAAQNEEAMAMIAMAANAGIKGSKAGTSIRTGLLAFGTSTKSSEELAEELGITVSDATKMQLEAQSAMNKVIDPAKLAEIEAMQDDQSKVFAKLKAFSQGIKDMSAEEQSALIAEVFKKNAYSGMATVVKSFQNIDENGVSEIEKFVAGLKNSEGTAAAISKNMTNNLRGDITILESTMESLSQNVGEAILPAMRTIVQAITPIIAKISAFARENSTLVQNLAMLAGAISGVIIAGAGIALLGNIFAFASSGFSMFIAGIKMIPVLLSTLSLSMLPIIAGIALIAGAGYLIISNWSNIAPFFENIFGNLSEKLSASFNIIAEQFAHVGNLLSRIGDGNAFGTVASTIIAVFTGVISFVASAIASIVSMIANLFASIENIAAGIGDFFTALTNLDFSGMIEAGKRIGSGILDGIKAIIFDGIGGIIGSALDSVKIGTGVFDSIKSIWNSDATNPSSGFSNEIVQPQIDPTSVENLNVATQQTSINMQNFDTSMQSTSSNLSLLDSQFQQIASSTSTMGGSFDQVTAALSSKAAEISAIQISAPTISIPAGGIPVAQNAIGGIYSKGNFLTTFAENSAEAAIPIDGSQRAQNLWLQTGKLLGMLPNEKAPDSGGLFNPLSPSGAGFSDNIVANSNPNFNLTINVNGAADQSSIDQMSSVMRESFEDLWRSFNYERTRVAFS